MIPYTEQKGINFNINFENSVPDIVTTDEQGINAVLMELLSNAQKYTYEGDIKVNVKYSKPFLIISVRDTGCGIPEDKATKIHQLLQSPNVRFEKIYGDKCYEYGLLKCRQVCHQFNGKITFES